MKRISTLRLAAYLLFVLATAIAACTFDNEEDLFPEPTSGCDATAGTYSATLVPALERSCYSCHAVNIATAGVILDSYDAVQPFANSGTLFCTLSHIGSCATMPPGGQPLDSCTLAQLQFWIDEGAPNN